jgi:hypothetical protein
MQESRSTVATTASVAPHYNSVDCTHFLCASIAASARCCRSGGVGLLLSLAEQPRRTIPLTETDVKLGRRNEGPSRRIFPKSLRGADSTVSPPRNIPGLDSKSAAHGTCTTSAFNSTPSSFHWHTSSAWRMRYPTIGLRFHRRTRSNPCDFNEFLQALQSSETIRDVKCCSQLDLGIAEDEWVLLVKTIGRIRDVRYLNFSCTHGSRDFHPFQAVADAVNSAHSLRTFKATVKPILEIHQD